ncbi:hypothetical protein GF367_00280 [Candidatus Woesearchaeota archaeon]|nr:hypothetical protein [Candidatus Woesearchaeota archaeon]
MQAAVGFAQAMRRIKFFVFSLLGGIVFLALYALLQHGWMMLGSWIVFVMYLYFTMICHVAQRTRFLIKLIPLIVVCGSVAIVILTGLFTAVVREGAGEFFDGPRWERFFVGGEAVPFSPYHGSSVFWGLVVVVVGLLVACFGALRGLLRMLRVRHRLEGHAVRFTAPHKDYVVYWRGIRSLVVGETNVFVCKNDEEEEAALEYVNRPYSLRLSSPVLDGVLYLDTDKLISDAHQMGLDVHEEALATIITTSSS